MRSELGCSVRRECEEGVRSELGCSVRRECEEGKWV